MGTLMRNHAWSGTPFGLPSAWPQSLRSAVSIMLNSRYPIALYWGPDLALLYNDAWSPILGGKHPWALGRPGREVWPEIWDTIGPLYEKVIRTGEGVWQEDELLPMLRHGYVEECYFNFTFSPVRGEDGTIDGIFNAVVETTDRVLSERRLRTLSRMGERADASLSLEAACNWATDILAGNRADVPFALVYLREGDAMRLVASAGLEPDSLAAPPTVAGDEPASVWPFPAGADAHAIVVPAPADAGLVSDFWSEPIAEVVVAPIVVASEERPSAFLVAGANPRRRLNATYRSFFELAAGHIGTALSTARAYADERRRVQALADLDRAKTAFFSNVSHEFRTPLTLMLGPLEDALAAAENVEQRSRLDLAHRNAMRLLRLVNALLDFSRLEAGRVDATFQETDLAVFTADLASSFRSATDRAGLRLEIDTPPLPTSAFVDRQMWETIVLNLISNAFKFTEKGEIAVALKEVEGKAILTVRDTGTGIPEAALPKLFDRFQRVEGARGRSFEGSGIGLALVKELVALHGGSVGVESREGVGTTFTVAIPLGSAHIPPERIRASGGEMGRHSHAQAFLDEATRWLPDGAAADRPPKMDEVRDTSLEFLSAASDQDGNRREHVGARVLLADDNADLRDYIARLLAEAGYDVATAPDGEAAFARLHEIRPELLITDVMMPRLDGFGLLRRIREDGRFRDLPVIMLSARAGEEAKLEGLDAGADDYLIKPFSARELLARVGANIRLSRLRNAASEAVRVSETRLRELNADLNRRVADALAEKRLFVDVVEAADASVQAIDKEFRFLAINPRACLHYERLFGTQPQAGQSLLEVLSPFPAECEAARRVWARVLAGEAFTETGWWGGEGHERRAFETRFSPLFDAQGQQIGAFSFGQDVTERLREQERLTVAEAQLRQAQKMDAVGQLTGGIAHDFNNLLQGVAGSLDMIRRRPEESERVRRYAEAGLQAAERGAKLTSQLLAFSRAQKLEAKPLSVPALVNAMREILDRTLGPEISVAYDVDDRCEPVLSDVTQLEMALLNLAINARDAMEGAGELTIGVRQREILDDPELDPDGYVELSVSDTGQGMSPAVMMRAFDPFFTTKEVGKGTGLGLSQVYGIARQAGGTARIESRLGHGTTVRLYLRKTHRTADGIAAPASASRASARSAAVLVIDDDPDVRRFFIEALGELGFRAEAAKNGSEGLEMAEQFVPDLAIVDYAMPGMNGAEVFRALRERRPDLPIIFASGYANTTAIEEAAGPHTPVLRKPFQLDELEAVIAEALNRSG